MKKTTLLEHFDQISEASDAIPGLRQFILDLSVRGRLVEPDPDEDSIAGLLEEISREVDELKKRGEFREPRNTIDIRVGDLPFSVPETWGWCRLIELADVRYGFAFPSANFNDEHIGMPLIRIRDISNEDTEAYYEGEFNSVYIVNEGDILVGMDGDFNLRKWGGPRGLLNQRVMRIRDWRANVNPDYVAIPLQLILNYLHSDTSLTTVKHLSAKQVGGIRIPLPSIKEQNRLVAKVNELMELCDKLESNLIIISETRRDLLHAALHEAMVQI